SFYEFVILTGGTGLGPSPEIRDEYSVALRQSIWILSVRPKLLVVRVVPDGIPEEAVREGDARRGVALFHDDPFARVSHVSLSCPAPRFFIERREPHLARPRRDPRELHAPQRIQRAFHDAPVRKLNPIILARNRLPVFPDELDLDP